MKNLCIAVLVIATFNATAQDSALLRLNYAKGDNYLVETEIKQSMGAQGGMDMKMSMAMIVENTSDASINTKSNIMSVDMNMMQGGMTMSYNSNQEEEELDQMGKMLKAQFDPMMKASIHNTFDKLGNVTASKIEPSVPGMEQFTQNIGGINYPKEKVSVGYSWSSENENQGIKTMTTYTVKSIANGVVTLDISGTLKAPSGGEDSGKIKGSATIDIKTGIQKSSNTEVTMTMQGSDMTISSSSKISKN